MSQVRFTARARDDLLEIWVYLAEHGSEALADRVLDSIERACARLREHPGIGRARAEIHPEARSLVVERWLAFYRLTDDGAQVVRVMDGARDLTAMEWTLD